MASSENTTDMNENYSKSGAVLAKNEPIEKKLERKLSIEIKKVPLQESPKSFEASAGLQRGLGIKMKSASSYAVDQLAKPPMSTSLESLSVMSSNPCIDCRSFKSVKTLEDTPHQRSCNPPRPDHLPLEKELSVSTNFGNEQTKCKNVSSSADKHLDTYSFDSKTVLNSSVLASQTTSLSDHSNAPTPQAPLSFTNPLHSDDSDTEENNSYGSMTKSLSNISTASATVSAVSATESSSRKVVPMSIARHDKKHTSAEKGKSYLLSSSFILRHAFYFLHNALLTIVFAKIRDGLNLEIGHVP